MRDLRAPALGGAAWLGGIAAAVCPWWVPLGVVVGTAALLLRSRGAGPLVAFAAVAGVTLLHGTALASGPVAQLAQKRAVVGAELTVTSDPRPVAGRFGDLVVVRARVEQLTGRGAAYSLSTPVVVMADASWLGVVLGERLHVSGRLGPADGDSAALLMVRGSPDRIEGPDVWWRVAAAVRGSIRESVEPRQEDTRELVPALVVGDDAGVDPALADDFRTTGLTHLLAVSGTNLTLLVGFLLIASRWAGVRGWWLHGVAAVGIAGFVLLARTEPSVVRAAAMGTVALIGMGGNGRERGPRALGVAVLALLLLDPRLAVTAGFALSVLATAGILWLAPLWRDSLRTWLPRGVAEAVAVPLAAQVACTPVVTALSGEVSLVAVVANLLAAPAVAPATVLGLAGGLVGLVWMPLGQVVAAPAAWSVGWIAVVARRGADLPTAAIAWGTGPVALLLVTLVCLGLVVVVPRVLRSPLAGVACSVLLVVTVLTRPPTPGWPPSGWVLAMCDVGQGDALILRAGPHEGVVVDAGPDPALVDGCLDRLEVTRVPLLVLTHFHADHVDGLSGVLAGRTVGAVEVTALGDPPDGVEEVARATGAAGLRPAVAAYGATRRVGDVTLQTLWPRPDVARFAGDLGEDGSAANDASVVLLAEVDGLRILLTGDIEPPAQLGLSRLVGGLAVDVLKVPHHGSRRQDLGFLTGLRARLALVSVGADNDYGHPAPELVTALESAGTEVHRTDLDGDVLVVVRDGQLGVVARGGVGRRR
ncbi:ComEC/Rec2 family competence protein [Nocardioides gansuensis]|uniref:ComEC/Rec2 family competence protein n=1 Tax=Nocardioides gansuensis TaxID=2138300 RepID=UPI001FE88A7F|nr:ComEC/Rec2 family competence protein [Nocardioides gansuensis]